MAIASFEELCQGITEIAAVDAPELQPDETGTLAFTLHFGDVPVTVLRLPRRPDAAFLVAEFGPMPEARAVDGWRALLEVNLEMTMRNGPVFGRNRRTGEVTVHRCFPLDEATPIELYQSAADMAEVATSWRRDQFLESGGPGAHLGANPATADRA